MTILGVTITLLPIKILLLFSSLSTPFCFFENPSPISGVETKTLGMGA